jgi:hypothetical protein
MTFEEWYQQQLSYAQSDPYWQVTVATMRDFAEEAWDAAMEQAGKDQAGLLEVIAYLQTLAAASSQQAEGMKNLAEDAQAELAAHGIRSILPRSLTTAREQAIRLIEAKVKLYGSQEGAVFTEVAFALSAIAMSLRRGREEG